MTTINSSNSIMQLATRFDNLGGWTVEQQFVLQMGSSYLLAHGIGTPITEDPTTKVKVEKAGKYTLWVRTKNWTAFWSEGKTPGIFQVKIDGVADEAEFGIGCQGATRAERAAWYWQKGGVYELAAGEHEIAWHDVMGLDGRCDAILLTTADQEPGNTLEDYRHEQLCAFATGLLQEIQAIRDALQTHLSRYYKDVTVKEFLATRTNAVEKLAKHLLALLENTQKY